MKFNIKHLSFVMIVVTVGLFGNSVYLARANDIDNQNSIFKLFGEETRDQELINGVKNNKTISMEEYSKDNDVGLTIKGLYTCGSKFYLAYILFTKEPLGSKVGPSFIPKPIIKINDKQIKEYEGVVSEPKQIDKNKYVGVIKIDTLTKLPEFFNIKILIDSIYEKRGTWSFNISTKNAPLDLFIAP